MKPYEMSLFPEEELNAEAAYLHTENSLFGDDSIENEFPAEKLEMLREVELDTLADFPQWTKVAAFLKRRGARTLFDAVHLRPDDILRVKGTRLNQATDLQHLQRELLTNADPYIDLWQQMRKPIELTLGEYYDYPSAITQLYTAALHAAEIWERRNPKHKLVHDFLKKGVSPSAPTDSSIQTTSKGSRQIVTKTLRAFAAGEPVENVTLARADAEALHAIVAQNRFHYFPATLVTPILETLTALFGMSIVGPSEANTSWDFALLVGQNEVIEIRFLLTQILMKIARIQLPLTEEELVQQMKQIKTEGRSQVVNREEFVRSVIHHHPWIEHMDNERYRLATTRLIHTSERLARIIYDNHAPIKVSDIADCYQRTFGLRLKSVNLTSGLKFWDGYICHGRTGYWEYRPGASRPLSLNQQLRKWLDDGTLPHVFHLDDVYRLIDQAHAKLYPENTIRSYLYALCTTSADDDKIFCLRQHTNEHPEHQWRSNISRNKSSNIAQKLRQFLSAHPNHEAYAKEAADFIVQRSLDSKINTPSKANVWLKDMTASSQEEAIAHKRLIYEVNRYGMNYVKLNEHVTQNDCISYSQHRRANVASVYNALYNFARTALNHPENNGRIRMSELLQQFSTSTEYAALEPAEQISMRRMRAAFNENVIPPGLQRISQPNEKGKIEVYIALQ